MKEISKTDISIIRLPDFVFLQTNDGWIRADASENTYVSQNSSVLVTLAQSDLTIQLTANQPIKKILLRWNAQIGEDAKLLGDAWERGYGDLEWRGRNSERIMPWYFYLSDKEFFYGIGVKTGANAMCYWQTSNSDICLYLDVRCGTYGVEIKETLTVAQVVFLKETTDNAFDSCTRFCHIMCDNGVFPTEPIYGGNNWYNAYGNSSESQILEDSKRIANYALGLENKPFMVIDAGWQACGLNNEVCSGGPYKEGNYKFPDMKRMAEQMKQIGVRPGLWCRPTKTMESLPYEYFVFQNILDPTVPQVQELIKADMKRFVDWGFELIKHDFSTFDFFNELWGFQMGSKITPNKEYHFADKSKTTAQAIKLFYQSVYEGAKGAYIIGCNTIGHLAAGYVHLQRTGDDTSGLIWERTRKMGINTLAFRMPQHDQFYYVDADCVGITKKVPWEKNKQWLDVLAKSGTPLFVSLDEDMATEEVESAIKEAFKIASHPQSIAKPLDWFSTTVPEYWQIGDNIVHYEWDDNYKTASDCDAI